jgi:hypothetical protein
MKFPSVVSSFVKSSCLALLGLVLLTGLGAQAAAIVTSQIVGFPPGTNNLGNLNGLEGWFGSSGNLTVVSNSGSLNGVSLGLYPSAGDKVNVAYTSAVNPLQTYNVFVNGGTFLPSVRTNLYYSFLYVFNTLTNMSSATSNKICLVNRQNGSSGAHFEVHATTNASGQIKLGIMKPGGTPVYSTKTVVPGQVFFVVLRQQILPGSANDVDDLWINPDPSKFGVAEGSEPSPDASTFDGTEDASTTGPGRFYVIAGVNANFDEFRMSANSWADVTPSAVSCTPASFDSSPTNTTVIEGVAATLRVTSSSSSPAFHWQVSTNNGATWQNAVSGYGAATATYTTGPLTTSDNGTRYRAIASVACGGGTSATSAVAVVTVTAAAPTPVGVVVDDQFDDLSRVNTPIGISNSVWFASATTSLSDGSSGDLTAIPGSGASRLWLSYFTQDTNQPVHLAVGRAIKANLVFTPNNIQGPGANSLRFGLFNYADGGIRVDGDDFGSGSAGNGANVRGYMMTLNFGTNFTVNTPEQLLARVNLGGNGLMGTSGDFDSLVSGPVGATLTNAPAFANGVPYTLNLTVERLSPGTVNLTASITGGGTNYTTSFQDTIYAYPRFDAFAIRPESVENTAGSFTISRLLVQVVNATPAAIPLNVSSSGGNVTLTWTNSQFSLQAAPSITGTFTNVPGAVSGYTVPASGQGQFYRLKY